MAVTYDKCVCVTVQPQIMNIPNFTWTFRNEPDAFTLDTVYPTDPSYPLIDRSDNSCWGTFGTPTTSPTTTYETHVTLAGIVTISNPSTQHPTIVFDDSGVTAANINSLSGVISSHESVMIEFDVTVTITTADSWYV